MQAMKLTLADLTKLHSAAPHDKWGWSSHVIDGRALRTNGTAYRWGRIRAMRDDAQSKRDLDTIDRFLDGQK